MKLALVTGGYRRVGGVIATRLARAGWALALHSHSAARPEGDLAGTLGEWHGFVADLSDAVAVDALLPAIVARFGQPPDLIVNSASLFEDDDAATATRASMDRHHAINAQAPVALALALHRSGRAGCVVNILDQRVRNPNRDQLSYTLSKLALAGATRALAVALAPQVRVNGVAPGFTIPNAGDDAAKVARIRAAMPLKRTPAPADIADAVLYLANAAAVTGQTIFVDGGANLTGYERDFGYF